MTFFDKLRPYFDHNRNTVFSSLLQFRLFQNAVDPFLTVLQDALPAEVLQHPQQLAVADVEGLGQTTDICNALGVAGILERQSHPLFQRHLHRGSHCAVELGRQAGAEIPQKSRVVEQNLLILLQIKGQGIYIRPGLHKEGGKLGIHKTDLIQFLLGQKVVRSTARLATLDKRGADEQLIGVDDNAICIFEMADGPLQTYDVEQIQTNDNQTKSGVIDLWVDCLLAYPLEYMSPKIPGLGDVNWGAFVTAMNDIRYDGDAVIEVEDKAFEGSREDILKSIRLSKRYLDQFIL